MGCLACAHSKRDMLEQDLSISETPDWKHLRNVYGIHHLSLMRHKREHMKPAATEIEALPLMTCRVTDTPMSQFKQHLGPLAEAYHRADDLTMRDRMRFLLNEALQSEDMGL